MAFDFIDESFALSSSVGFCCCCSFSKQCSRKIAVFSLFLMEALAFRASGSCSQIGGGSEQCSQMNIVSFVIIPLIEKGRFEWKQPWNMGECTVTPRPSGAAFETRFVKPCRFLRFETRLPFHFSLLSFIEVLMKN